MKYRFIVDPVLCTGCRTCELACAFSHARELQRGRSRIYPLPHGKDRYVPVTCLQCDDPACVKSCAFNALIRNEETGAVELDPARCTKCMACIAACPFGCALYDEVHDEVVKCDLCKGDPACAHFCPSKALRYTRLTAK